MKIDFKNPFYGQLAQAEIDLAEKKAKKEAAAFKAEQDRIMRETRPEEAGASFAAGARRETDTRGANAFLSPLSIGV